VIATRAGARLLFLVKVDTLVCPGELEPDDRAVPGRYAIALDPAGIARHPDSAGFIELAKDIFHDAVPIGNLDDFTIEVSILGSEHDLPGDVEWLTQASCTLPTWTDQGAGNMADTYLQGSFAFRCTTAEADLLVEALRALHHIMMEDEPELPSPAMMEIFPPSRADAPWSGLIDVMPDPDFPSINADFSRDDVPDMPGMATIVLSSMEDFQPLEIAELIHGCCRTTLAIAPVGFEWAVTCSRPRIDEFGGGWCAVFADRILYENTGRALDRVFDPHGDDGPGYQIIDKRSS
jgi:hypothetical protein